MTTGRPLIAGLAGFAAVAAVGALILAMSTGRTAGEIDTSSGDVWWPRFPFASDTRVERDIAVLYTTDGLGPNTTLAELGYPGRMIFRLHEDHPQVRVVLTSCPASRYSGGRPVDGATEAGASWKMLALDKRFDWLELANQGYSHSPDDDTNRNHHEFSTGERGCNIDHARLGAPDYCRTRFRLAREAYRALGIPDHRVSLVRFPGSEDSPSALQAALEAGFLAVLGSRHSDLPGRDWWVPTAGDREILEIENSRLLALFARSDSLESALAQGRVKPGALADTAEFKAIARQGESYVEEVAADGGILNLSDQWRETFAIIGGVAPRYLVLDAVLGFIERSHGPRAWYPGGRELALWLDARRNATVTVRPQDHALLVRVEAPPWWSELAPEGFDQASLVIRLPAGWIDAGRVQVREGPEGAGWRDLESSRRWIHPRGLAVMFSLRGTITFRVERGE